MEDAAAGRPVPGRGPVIPGLHRGLGWPSGGQARGRGPGESGRGFGRVRELERGDRAGHVDGPGRDDGGRAGQGGLAAAGRLRGGDHGEHQRS